MCRSVVRRGLLGSGIAGEVRGPVRESRAGLSVWEVPALFVQPEKDMDTQDHVGSGSILEQLLCDVDVQRREFEAFINAVSDACRVRKRGRSQPVLEYLDSSDERWVDEPFVSPAARVAGFLEALAQGDRASADAILRRWRIRQ